MTTTLQRAAPTSHQRLALLRRNRSSGRLSWMALGLSLVAYASIQIVTHHPFHVGGRGLNYFDLQIYRGGAERVVHALALYHQSILGRLGFTYPPFAALVFMPLAYLPLAAAELVVTVGNLLLLGWTLHRAFLIRRCVTSSATSADSARKRRMVLFSTAAAIWLEPISVALGYGQVDLLIAALVVFDLSRPDSARTKGATIGLAAALKLTPLLFLVYLLMSGRRRAAALGAAVFAASIGLSFAVVRGDAAAYWGRVFFSTSRIGNGSDTANQSLRGALARLSPAVESSLGGHLAIVAITILGLWLAVRASRKGDEAAGFSFAALSTLLASPISWTHHWALVVPALMLLGQRAYDQQSPRLARCTVVLGLVGYSYLPEAAEGTGGPHGIVSLVTSDPYVLIALIVLATAAVASTRDARPKS
jgi:alpha-1,2-mannosyltransferase